MTQILLVQPTANETSTAQTVTTASPEAENSFSPHLEEAIASQAQRQESTTTRANEPESVSTLTFGETAEASLEDIAVATEQSFTLSTESPEQLLALSSAASTGTTIATTTTSGTNIKNNLTGQLSHNSVMVNLVQANETQQLELNTSGKRSPLSTTVSIADSSATSAPTTQLTSNQQILLSQLQQIIESGNEKGVVTINSKTSLAKTGSENGSFGLLSVNQETGTLQELQAVSGFRTINEELTGAAARPNQQLTPLRQDSNHQYYNAKTQPQNATNLNANNPENSSGENTAQSNNTGQAQTSAFATTAGEETTNTFSLSASSTNLENSTIQSATTGKPIILPSGTLVYEQDVMQQLTEKFQINRRQLDTQINVKLHPAELGEMKIDLSVKEGVVRANVIAQSQYAQEIVEKNVAKLKTILEEQGFTIDEITVTAESNSSDSFDLFDSQLFSSNDSSSNQKSTNNEAVFSIEELTEEETSDDNSSGVNVTV